MCYSISKNEMLCNVVQSCRNVCKRGSYGARGCELQSCYMQLKRSIHTTHNTDTAPIVQSKQRTIYSNCSSYSNYVRSRIYREN